MIPTIKLSSPALNLRNEMILAYESRKEIFQFGAVATIPEEISFPAIPAEIAEMHVRPQKLRFERYGSESTGYGLHVQPMGEMPERKLMDFVAAKRFKCLKTKSEWMDRIENGNIDSDFKESIFNEIVEQGPKKFYGFSFAGFQLPPLIDKNLKMIVDQIKNCSHACKGIPNADIPVGFVSSASGILPFPMHYEADHFWSNNFMVTGMPQLWLIVPGKFRQKIRELGTLIFGNVWPKNCNNPLDHFEFFFSPNSLRKFGIPFEIILHRPGNFLMAMNDGLHQGIKFGSSFSIAGVFGHQDMLEDFDASIDHERCGCTDRDAYAMTKEEESILRTKAARIKYRKWDDSRDRREYYQKYSARKSNDEEYKTKRSKYYKEFYHNRKTKHSDIILNVDDL